MPNQHMTAEWEERYIHRNHAEVAAILTERGDPISRKRVEQIHARALKKIRLYLERNPELREAWLGELFA